MRPTATAALASLAMVALSVGACTRKPAGPCAASSGPPVERLQALARQYHPEVLSPDRSRASALVGFVLDEQCRVLHDTAGQRPADWKDVDSALATLFPRIRIQPFVAAGILFATADTAQGSPQIVWVVSKD
ncbi:MAG TPA: hypothetical protein VMT29_17735 [Steroidobacteraceae bacterium]|nr:hypothetical protein [Steroidobacteraceae bacterium]